jgi:pseudouridine synthase
MKIRLHQFLSRAGFFEKKQDAIFAVRQGHILVDKAPMRDLYFEFNPAKKKVYYRTDITQSAVELHMHDLVYFVLHKPLGVICSRLNSQELSLGKVSVFDVFKSHSAYLSLHTVGRLDEDTSGLLIVTNDGRVSKYITNPAFAVQKTYRVRVDAQLTDIVIRQLLAGVLITVEDGVHCAKFDSIIRISDSQCEVKLHEGKKREIRLAFQAVGLIVVDLVRTHIGQLELSSLNLAEGSYKQVDFSFLETHIPLKFS